MLIIDSANFGVICKWLWPTEISRLLTLFTFSSHGTVEPRLYQPRLYHKPRLKQQKGSDLISYLIKPPKNPDYITHFENEKPRLYHSFFWEK